MLEKQIEAYFVKRVKEIGGVADRVVCLPDGSTWFVELKAANGRLSALQQVFQSDMARMNQKYACLWSKEHVDGWIKDATA